MALAGVPAAVAAAAAETVMEAAGVEVPAAETVGAMARGSTESEVTLEAGAGLGPDEMAARQVKAARAGQAVCERCLRGQHVRSTE